ncbi:FtsK/SpoIIIE domain-containing protein [Streptomyces tsukubensis]|uniref:FtsK/SpoIIIE domain-containing protein n=1 Tax=Streptomyces tsukubensis TaxID=83656 RepID=UPI00344E06AB
MRLTVTVADPAPDPDADPEDGVRSADFLIDTDPRVPAGALAAELFRQLHGRPAATAPVLHLGAEPVPADRPVGEAGLLPGGVLGLGAPLPLPGREPDGTAELRAVGGADAGAVFRLPPGEYEVGADASCTVRLTAEGLPGTAARLRIGADGSAQVRSVPSGAEPVPSGDGARSERHTVLLDGEPAPDWTPFPVGGILTAGPVLLERTEPSRPDAALQRSDDGTGLDYNRPPRLLPPPVQNRFRMPGRPAKPPRSPLQLVMIFAPLLMALVFVVVLGNARFLIFGLLSPVIALASQLSSKRRGKESYEDQLKDYEERRARLDRDVAAAVTAEERARRAACPDPAAVTLIATGPRQRLWERRWRDPDFLLLRLGVADRPAHLELEDPDEAEHRRRIVRTTHAVPVAVPLRTAGVAGVAGGAAATPLVRWLIGQAAALHSPSDLRICVLSGNRDRLGDADRWSWLHWLPHSVPLGDGLLGTAGTSAESTGRRIAELAALVAARQEAGDRAPRGGAAGEPDVLVVLDGARRLRSLPGVIPLLREGPAFGVYFLCVDEEARLLPEECQAVAVAGAGGGPGRLRVEQAGADPVDDVLMDAPGPGWINGIARSLAPVRDVGDDTEESLLPVAARLLDVLGLEPPTGDAIAAGWTAGGGRSTRAVIGEGVDGPFAVDLAADGPHALIAGTTGAGKSELLQSLVASLAVANRPDELNFVLVDYKGGSAFAECEDLPHTVGMVTDLDTHLVERALVSLGAELKRRERILAAAAAKDVDDYLENRTRTPGLGPMPRLVLVIDEFASMVRELPDFVTGLVGIAQRGRSLGIHLVLATQRPSGAVTSDIRANTNLRIALRTTDTGESRDIIDASEAGRISPRTPGRAYARLGHAALLPFQTGRIGGRRTRPSAAADEPGPPRVTELAWELLGEPPAPAAAGERTTVVQSVTDLAVLVEAVREAAARLDLPEARRPWLPPLPELLTLDELPGPGSPDARDGSLAPVPYGLVDLPDEQDRRPLLLDLGTLGHLHLIGSPRGGRSQLLRTLAAALARAHSSADVHLYGLDCGNGALAALAGLPHCGAVVDRSQPERVARLLTRLAEETARRRTLLGRAGTADLTELRRSLPEAERPPHILLLIDRFETFERDFGTYDQGAVLDTLLALLREGASAGIHLVITGDRVLTQSRFAATTEDKLVLRLNERNDYAMAGLSPRTVPATMPPGRAIDVRTGRSTHLALIAPDPAGAAQAEALAALGERVRDRDTAVPPARRPFRVDLLPSELSFDDAWSRRPAEASPLWAMAGVGGDELAAIGTDLSRVPSFLIAGPARSGRSTLLLTMARSLLAHGTGIVVVAPFASPLRALAGRPGVAAVFTEADPSVAAFRTALGRIDSPAGAVLVDDADMLIGAEIDGDLSALARGSAGDGWGLVAAGNNEALFSGVPGWHALVRRNRCGALLAPRALGDGEILGLRVPHGLLGADTEPGRAHLHLGDGRFRTVRVPAPAADGAAVPAG